MVLAAGGEAVETLSVSPIELESLVVVPCETITITITAIPTAVPTSAAINTLIIGGAHYTARRRRKASYPQIPQPGDGRRCSIRRARNSTCSTNETSKP